MKHGPASITSALQALSTGETTAVALLEDVEARADAFDASIGVYLHRTREAAMAAAVAVDSARDRGEPVGPLAGIPLGVKDIIRTADAPTTAQSLIPVVGGPATWGPDASVVTRLRRAGAVLTGKTSTLEFALGFSDPEKPFPIPRNPWDLDRWSGGSSSGSGSGTAAGLFLGALGTDTAGSIRMPAAWCGITGFKPTYGLVPRTGVFPLGWSYDHVGPMARTAEDCALLLAVLAGAEGSDPTVPARSAYQWSAEPQPLPRGLRIGIAVDPMERSEAEVQALVRAAADVLADAGCAVSEVRLPEYEAGCDVTMLGLAAEAFAYHRPELRARWHEYSRTTRNAAMTGALMSGGDYVQIQRVRRHVVREVSHLFEKVDLVIGPTASGPAPLIDGIDFAKAVTMLQTTYWNATGTPALSVPMGQVGGLPVGLQICGPAMADQLVLDTGRHFQRMTGHHWLKPGAGTMDARDF